MIIAGGFHQATDVALTFEAQGSSMIKSLAIPSARPQADSRTAADVAWALWKRKPMARPIILEMRIRALRGSGGDKIEEDIAYLDDLLCSHALHEDDSVSPSPLPLRHVRINDGQVTARELLYIGAMVYGHETMASIALQANLIRPKARFTMRAFAIAASLSNLRHIELSNNPIGIRSITQLLQHLRMPSLTHLYLSMTMRRGNLSEEQESNELWTLDEDQSWKQRTGEEVWSEELDKLTNRLVQLVQARPDQQPYCPRLSFLTLNGNDLNWRCVKRIVSAVQEGSRSLEEVGLFSTIDDADQSDEEGDGQPMPQSGIRRVTSIGTYMIQNGRSGNMPVTQGRSNDDNTSRGHAVNPTVRLITFPMPESGSSFGSVEITRETWRKCLGNRLWSNRKDKIKSQDASRKLLSIARTLACQCREGKQDQRSTKTFPLIKLPPEVRHRIMYALFDDETLSNDQVENVISFASDRGTIGYGQRSAWQGLSAMALEQIKRENKDYDGTMQHDGQSPGLLLHRPWNWTAMCARHSVPRDWPATTLDQSPSSVMPPGSSSSAVLRREDHDVGGGGGPDGEGGNSTVQVTRAGRDWLNEQAGLQAFWEATATYAAP
jgi:hypothetical protein